MNWSSLVIGAMSLAVLEGIVSTKGGPARASGAFGMVGGFVRDFISPAVPAFAPAPKAKKAKATGATSPIPAPSAATLQTVAPSAALA